MRKRSRVIEGQERADIEESALDAVRRRKPVMKVIRGPKLSEPRWFIVHTEAGQEAHADRKLQQAGYATFFAFDRVRRRRKRPGMIEPVIEWIEKAYFSRYLFVALRFEADNIQAVEECDGVSCVVRSRLTSIPYEIPSAQLDLIMEAAMVRFDVDCYRALMREIVLDPDKQITISKNSAGGRIMDYLPASIANIA